MSNRDENELFISMETLHQLYLHVCRKENQSILSTRNAENRRKISPTHTYTHTHTVHEQKQKNESVENSMLRFGVHIFGGANTKKMEQKELFK